MCLFGPNRPRSHKLAPMKTQTTRPRKDTAAHVSLSSDAIVKQRESLEAPGLSSGQRPGHAVTLVEPSNLSDDPAVPENKNRQKAELSRPFLSGRVDSPEFASKSRPAAAQRDRAVGGGGYREAPPALSNAFLKKSVAIAAAGVGLWINRASPARREAPPHRAMVSHERSKVARRAAARSISHSPRALQ